MKVLRSKTLVRWFRRTDGPLRRLLIRTSPVLASRYIFYLVRRRRLNLRNPKTLSEKLIWIKHYWRDPRLVDCTDKHGVRNYVARRGHAEILNELYGVYEDPADIPWDTLPDRFALKCTHGCGCNIICADKSRLDRDAARAKLSRWLRTDYAMFMAEMHYRKIKPRIVCERFVGTETGRFPVDYKILCFNGKARVHMICTGRDTKVRFTFRDLDWKVMDIASESHPPIRDQEKPAGLPRMVELAESLADGIPFVRVDFYDHEGRIVFGEMTFTPAGGFVAYFNDRGDRLMGPWLELPGTPAPPRRPL